MDYLQVLVPEIVVQCIPIESVGSPTEVQHSSLENGTEKFIEIPMNSAGLPVDLFPLSDFLRLPWKFVVLLINGLVLNFTLNRKYFSMIL